MNYFSRFSIPDGAGMGISRLVLLICVLSLSTLALQKPVAAVDQQPKAQSNSPPDCPAPQTYSPRDQMLLNISCAAIAIRNSYQPKPPPAKPFWDQLGDFIADAWQAIVAVVGAAAGVFSWVKSNLMTSSDSEKPNWLWVGLGALATLTTVIFGLWFLTGIVANIATALGWIMFAIPLYLVAWAYTERTSRESRLLDLQIANLRAAEASKQKEGAPGAVPISQTEPSPPHQPTK